MSTETTAKAGRREWIGLAVIALPCLLYSMDLTVLHLAVPSLSADLKPTSTQLLWIVDIYGFMVAGSLLLMGTLGDRIGRRRLLLMGAVAFGIASVMAAFSTSAGMLIATRALLGIAGATLAPSTLSLISNMFHDPTQRTKAISVWAAMFSAGTAVGPAVGGFLLENFWWGSVFLIAVPVMVLLVVLGPLLLPEYKDPDAGRLDVTSAVQSLVAVLAVIYGLKQVAQDGFGFAPALLVFAGLAIGVLFVRRQKGLADPFIDLRLFSRASFSGALATNALTIFVVAGAFLFTAQYLQLVLGLSPLQAGLWSLPEAGALIGGSLLAPVMVRWMRPAYAVAAGLVTMAAGFGVLTLADGGTSLVAIVTGATIVSFGVAPVVTLGTDLIISSAPPERAGAASGLSETGAEFGGALGIALLGSIGTAVYRAAMSGGLPNGIPVAAARAAEDTLGGAVEVAKGLPAGAGEQLLEAAREAFTQGLHITALSGAAISIGLAVLAVSLLRGVRPAEEPFHEAEEPLVELALAG